VIEAGLDPAISKRAAAAKSALVVAGQVRRGLHRGRIYVLHAEAGHWSVLEQVERILWAVRDRKVRRVRIEDVAYQRALGDILDREARQRGIQVHVDLVPPDADKLRRANAWSPLVESGTVLFGPGQKALIDALLAVPADRTQWTSWTPPGSASGLPAAPARVAARERPGPAGGDGAGSRLRGSSGAGREPRSRPAAWSGGRPDPMARARSYAPQRVHGSSRPLR